MVSETIIPVLTVPALTGILDEDIIGAILLPGTFVVVLTRHADSFAHLQEHREPSLRGTVQGKLKTKRKHRIQTTDHKTAIRRLCSIQVRETGDGTEQEETGLSAPGKDIAKSRSFSRQDNGLRKSGFIGEFPGDVVASAGLKQGSHFFPACRSVLTFKFVYFWDFLVINDILSQPVVAAIPVPCLERDPLTAPVLWIYGGE